MSDGLTERADKLANRLKSLGGYSIEAEHMMELAEVVAALAQQVAKALQDKDKAKPARKPAGASVRAPLPGMEPWD